MKPTKGKRIGIIGLDAYHAAQFTKLLNSLEQSPALKGYRVVAAYPQGSKLLQKRIDKIPEYTKVVEDLGVKVVHDMDELLTQVDGVMLCSNDARVHLEQAMPVIKSQKKLFIDKPFAANLEESIEIFDAAEKYRTPIFTSSALRFIRSIQEFDSNTSGKVVGAHTFSPCAIEPYLADLLWYGIHGIEMLFAVMGTGCRSVQRMHTENFDVVTGVWNDGRIGTFRGFRKGGSGFGGVVFAEKSIITLGDFESYEPLVKAMVDFFESGNPPVSRQETLEIIAFIMAADESKRQGGKVVSIP
ncbi:MAG TPA: Gfo/Idh/MocA family oxidoreductase, partial [Chryseosolibacter sp.]|nr:Gfo/Idh/MocA family oxidoreductase [Chryseosolibacter sp.]